MSDTEPQTAGGKVLWHFTMSLDGFVAGPNHEIDLHIAPILLGQASGCTTTRALRRSVSTGSAKATPRRS